MDQVDQTWHYKALDIIFHNAVLTVSLITTSEINSIIKIFAPAG